MDSDEKSRLHRGRATPSTHTTSDHEALLADDDNEVNVSGSDMDDDDRAIAVKQHLIGSHNGTIEDDTVDSSSSDGDNSDDNTLPSDTTRFAELRVKQQQQHETKPSQFALITLSDLTNAQPCYRE